MRARTLEDFVQFDSRGRIIESGGRQSSSIDLSGVASSGSLIESHPNGGSYTGDLADEDSGDIINVILTAGQTYTWSYRGSGEDGVVDPWLRLLDTDGTTVLVEDDDGGLGRTSQITFTAPVDGTYYLNATSWYQVDNTPDSPGQDNGDYTIVQWSPEAGHDAGNTIGTTTATIGVGTNYLNHEAAGDRDFYAIELTAGNVYSFTYNGGIGSVEDAEDGEPGEIIPVMGLYDSAGNAVSSLLYSPSGELTINFVPDTSGTYYVRAEPASNFGIGTPGQTGGYTIDVAEIDPATRDPLESLNWDSAANIPTELVNGVPTATVYFAAAGEDVGTGEETFGWEQHQIDAVMHALNTQYTPITGINYVITTDIEDATFRMITVENLTYGARFYPNAPEYGDLAGIGSFNLLSGGFGSDPDSLLPGGYSYAVILHEFGHAHGIAHPHDTGGGSEVMLGVSASTGSLGLYDLNQGVYTVMSYNDGWQTHPDGTLDYSRQTRDNGWSETLGAFDIAVLQARYGDHDYNHDDTVYDLTQQQTVASYSTIWDSGGTDTIAFSGGQDAHIDLLAATLDYSPTGGGVVSFVSGTFGGYTIANNVVIENATGGSGNDVLLGNSANNVLTGNNGHDTLIGREGDDTLLGGNGKDNLNGSEGNDTLNGGAGKDVVNGGAGDDMLFGGNDRDVFVFTDAGTDTIGDYEGGEDLDLSGLDVTIDDVTIHADRIVVELGVDDLTIMFDTTGFSTNDLFFG